MIRFPAKNILLINHQDMIDNYWLILQQIELFLSIPHYSYEEIARNTNKYQLFPLRPYETIFEVSETYLLCDLFDFLLT